MSTPTTPNSPTNPSDDGNHGHHEGASSPGGTSGPGGSGGFTNPTLRYFEDVVDWRHRRAGRAHTLVRAVHSTTTGRVVAVVSELASNPDDRGVTDDFGSVADAVLPALRRAFGTEPVEVFWIAHFGAFSYHDPTGPESFTQILLTAGPNGHVDDLTGDRTFTVRDVEELLGRALEPVDRVLARIDHEATRG
ncbi:hypothetical protein [Streptomyces neyagawaensis]|uniref:hypothetical protein n=1 Tax=Streptomyces neyagawaensis TaxID=42238 RepID=UPI0006E322AA|nr:hypothetical protein [Streptomyces neyagawaensis]MCL6738647.1 hypothetical protein [Streptomyces neyagawaensis]MDE1686103.1 hypothetical protein [Streptomyces neyagawaensis]